MQRKHALAWVVFGCAWAINAFAADAKEVEYKRGDFRFYVGPPPAYVQPHDVPAQWDAKAPGTADTVWRFWLLDDQVDRRQGQDHEYTDYAYDTKTASNLGEAGRFNIEFNPEYQRLVMHRVEVRRDGQWQDRLLPDKISLARRESDFEQDMSDGRVSALIVLDDVRLGDVVRIAYTITGSNPILAGQTMEWARTSWRSPILDAHVRMLFDPGTQVRTHVENGLRTPLVRKQADRVEVVVDAHGNAAVVDEDNYPNWFQPYPALQAAPARTWGDVVAWATPLYPKVDALPADLEARIAQWAKLPDPQARLRAALRAVQDEVRYFGVEMGNNTHKPNDPATTWTRRYGDCKDKAYLLSTVLARLGIDAAPALVSTDRGRALRDFLPTAGAFNHVIVRAKLGGATVWVDPTMTQQGGDPKDTDLSDYGVGLPIVAGVSALETIPAPAAPHAGVRSVERYTPQGAGDGLRMDVETTYRGASADSARRQFAASRTDDLQRRYADYYRKRFGDVDITAGPVVQDDREANTLKVTESYLLKAPFANEGALRALDLYGEALDGASALPPTMARTGPLDVGMPADYRHEIHVAAPHGWRATAHPQEDAFASPAFDYKRSIAVADGTVDLVYEMKVKSREIDAAGAGAHLAELRRLRDTLSARVRFQAPPAKLEQGERDARLKALLRDAMTPEGTQ